MKKKDGPEMHVDLWNAGWRITKTEPHIMFGPNDHYRNLTKKVVLNSTNDQPDDGTMGNDTRVVIPRNEELPNNNVPWSHSQLVICPRKDNRLVVNATPGGKKRRTVVASGSEGPNLQPSRGPSRDGPELFRYRSGTPDS
jgi:hypothetical protein